jgi:hypothetical protein
VWSYTSTPQYAFMAWCSVKAQEQIIHRKITEDETRCIGVREEKRREEKRREEKRREEKRREEKRREENGFQRC